MVWRNSDLRRRSRRPLRPSVGAAQAPSSPTAGFERASGAGGGSEGGRWEDRQRERHLLVEIGREQRGSHDRRRRQSVDDDVRVFMLRIDAPQTLVKQPPTRELKWADVGTDRKLSRLVCP